MHNYNHCHIIWTLSLIMLITQSGAKQQCNLTRRLCVLSNTKLYHWNLLRYLQSLKSVWALLRITRLTMEVISDYLVIICLISHKKLELVQPDSLVWSIGIHIWSLFAPIHIKSWPKVKLGHVQVDSNIAQNHSSSP